jgi:predicted neutral ceramidase superfamily lipid hydrolase
MYKHVIFILVVSSIFGWISFNIHVMKSEPTLIGAISSILFVIIMFFYSAYMGKQNYVNFALFITKY